MFKKILVGVMALSLVASTLFATVTPTGLTKTTWGNKRIVMGSLVITGAPTSLGYALTARAIGLTKISQIYFYPNYSYPDYSWTYSSTGTGGYVVPMRNGWLDNKQVTAAGTSDTISVCLMKAGDWSADNDTVVVLVSPLSGGLARLHAPLPAVTTGALATAGIQYPIFTAGDGLTMGVMADTGRSDGPILRATNTTGSYYRGDTLYYLPGASVGAADRLVYSGRSGLGAAVAGTYADLYIPFGLGNYIKVKKVVSGDMTTAVPLYYAPKGALKYKFVAAKAAGRATYLKPITVDRVPTTSAGFTTILYFMAIGN